MDILVRSMTTRRILSGLTLSAEEGSSLLSAAVAPAYANHANQRRFSGASSIHSVNDSKYPSSTTTRGLDQSTFVPTIGAGGAILSSKRPYNPAELSRGREPDDQLHDPDPPTYKARMSGPSLRGCGNVLTLVIVVAIILGLFLVYPVTDFILSGGLRALMSNNQFVNGTGQVAVLATLPKLIDPDTPLDVRTRKGFDGEEYELVFSDEFNEDNRSFYPGDDPFWEALDIWYGATRDEEWYDPDNVSTRDGSLRIKLEEFPDSYREFNHNLTYKSAMLTTWNKFCFSNGYIEARVQLPGQPKAAGYWPGLWILGNLGRPGYGASTDGLWPYSYDSCDAGVMPNQLDLDGISPAGAAELVPEPRGRPEYGYKLSMLPGQRLSACTCKGEDHPGPWLEKENRFRGRGAPELDIIEATKCKRRGDLADQCVSQSAQFAPFDYNYDTIPDGQIIHSALKTEVNYFHGSPTQQSVSAISNVTNSTMRDGPDGGSYGVFGFEYFANENDPSQSYVSWVSDGERSHTVKGIAVGPNAAVGIDQRLIAPEPMSIILNLGISHGFQPTFSGLTFPNELSIDYVRVWQRKGSGEAGISCDPPGYPTTKYIQDHLPAYNNLNLTVWEPTFTRPKNRLRDPGSC
ncbi:beta-glucan synthesis-associated [Auriculariales sp. MPI-PUGE-AT-0066]|nr:beta-glucan synthesis-associated [Auriculariales sp. MPI-PUGE-AT-0066]